MPKPGLLLLIGLVLLAGCASEVADPTPDMRQRQPTPQPVEIQEQQARQIPVAAKPKCPNAAETAYFLAMNEKLRVIGAAGGQISNLFGQAESQPTLLVSDTWIAAVAVQFAVINVVSDELTALQGPSSVNHIHEQLDLISTHAKNAIWQYTYGIDNLDSVAIEHGGQLMSFATQETLVLERLLANFCDALTRSPTATPTPTPSPTPKPTPTQPMSEWLTFPTRIPTATPIPTPSPTAVPPTPLPSPTPDGPMLAKDECQQVITDYLDGIIESAILAGTDDPMDFRYWTEGTSARTPLGYNLQYQEYSGFGEKPEHHRVHGNVLVHWWNNEIDMYWLEFFPHPVTCLPVRDAGPSMSFYTFEHEHAWFKTAGHADAQNNVEHYLQGVEEPAGVVEVGR